MKIATVSQVSVDSNWCKCGHPHWTYEIYDEDDGSSVPSLFNFADVVNAEEDARRSGADEVRVIR